MMCTLHPEIIPLLLSLILLPDEILMRHQLHQKTIRTGLPELLMSILTRISPIQDRIVQILILTVMRMRTLTVMRTPMFRILFIKEMKMKTWKLKTMVLRN
jgi:hypothetical protein